MAVSTSGRNQLNPAELLTGHGPVDHAGAFDVINAVAIVLGRTDDESRPGLSVLRLAASGQAPMFPATIHTPVNDYDWPTDIPPEKLMKEALQDNGLPVYLLNDNGVPIFCADYYKLGMRDIAIENEGTSKTAKLSVLDLAVVSTTTQETVDWCRKQGGAYSLPDQASFDPVEHVLGELSNMPVEGADLSVAAENALHLALLQSAQITTPTALTYD